MQNLTTTLVAFNLIRAMKKIVSLLLVVVLSSCSSKKKVPDVSQITVDLKTLRFEKDFFSIDTNKIDAGLQILYTKQGNFYKDFFFNILGIPQHPDSVMHDAKLFIASYKNIYDASIEPFKDFQPIENQVKDGLKFVHYYFPKYPLPNKLITFIGPLNSYAGIITPDNAIAIGLQLYMGKNFQVYQSDEIQNLYPSYVSRRFEPEYIHVNCMKNIVDDLFASFQPKRNSTQLIEKMIDEGKKLYVLDAFLPNTPDTLKTGYTKEQLSNCFISEKTVWSYFMESDLLFQTDPTLISPYVNDGPKTSELGEGSPGNIGLFVGWQIVKKWMEKNDKITLQQLISTPAKQIFEEAKYKPH